MTSWPVFATRGLLADLCPPILFLPETCRKAKSYFDIAAFRPSALLVKCEDRLRKLADPGFWFGVAV